MCFQVLWGDMASSDFLTANFYKATVIFEGSNYTHSRALTFWSAPPQWAGELCMDSRTHIPVEKPHLTWLRIRNAVSELFGCILGTNSVDCVDYRKFRQGGRWMKRPVPLHRSQEFGKWKEQTPEVCLEMSYKWSYWKSWRQSPKKGSKRTVDWESFSLSKVCAPLTIYWLEQPGSFLNKL